MTFNSAEFQSQLDTYMAVATKTATEAFNKKVLDTAYTAAKLTPKLARSQISQDLHRDPHLIAALTSLRLKGEKLGNGQFKAAMRALELTRMAGAAYMVAGWGPLIEALGGKWDKGKKGPHGGPSAKMISSYAEKADAYGRPATLVWITDQDNDRKREGAENVAERAMVAAMEHQIDDMETYIARKLSEKFE